MNSKHSFFWPFYKMSLTVDLNPLTLPLDHLASRLVVELIRLFHARNNKLQRQTTLNLSNS